jgi:hypothetical protein
MFLKMCVRMLYTMCMFCRHEFSPSWYSSVTEEYEDGKNSYCQFFGLVHFLQLAIHMQYVRGLIHSFKAYHQFRIESITHKALNQQVTEYSPLTTIKSTTQFPTVQSLLSAHDMSLCFSAFVHGISSFIFMPLDNINTCYDGFFRFRIRLIKSARNS